MSTSGCQKEYLINVLKLKEGEDYIVSQVAQGNYVAEYLSCPTYKGNGNGFE
jgi:hypothetical protein